MKIAIVCMGNIFRSQVFEHYLKDKIGRKNIDIFSCGIQRKKEIPEEEVLLKEVREGLLKRGLNVEPKRTPWCEETKKRLKKADLILSATVDIKHFLIKEIGKKDIQTFYEFAGEDEKDFKDTFDYEKRKQDLERFAKGFDEIERLSKLSIGRIKCRFGITLRH